MFFLVLVVMALIILDSESRFATGAIMPIDYILMTLATWRLIRFFAYDTITRFFREQFWDLKKVGRSFELVKPTTGPRRTLADLLSCSACLGVWMGATVVFFYLLTPYAFFPVVILAISAVALFLQNLGTLIANVSDYFSKKTNNFDQ